MSLLTTAGLEFRYAVNGPLILDNITLAIARGDAVGIVGESGSGKSTLIRVLNGMLTAKAGTVIADGHDVSEWSRSDPRAFRRFGQMVFQSPRKSFDPRMRLARSLSEPVRALEGRIPARIELVGLMERVGLPAEMLDRFPHQLSGGQLQRVSVARAMSVRPQVLYADEPTSALDVSVQAQVLDLLMDMRADLGLTLVLVTHDLAVVGRLCEYIVVMRQGRIVEQGRAVDILTQPVHDYTAGLVAAARAVSLQI